VCTDVLDALDKLIPAGVWRHDRVDARAGRSMLRRYHDADRIADDYFTVAPLATGVSGMTMASRPSVSDAASIIP
jgi:hypothetical protein